MLSSIIECISYSIPEARKVVRKDFQGLSPAEEVIAEVSMLGPVLEKAPF